MNNNKYKQQIRSIEKKNKEKEPWESLKISFDPTARAFPDNKIYGTIKIEPEESREYIEYFLVIVDRFKPVQVDSHYQNISITGFDITKNKEVNVKIEAIREERNEKKSKESKTHTFSFTEEMININPIINFHWENGDSNPKVVVKWNHIDNQSIDKYILCLDNKEVQYVHKASFLEEKEIETHLCNLKPKKEYTIQIIAKLKNGKEKYRSDLMHFTVPDEKDQYKSEILTVTNELMPPSIRPYIKIIPKQNDSSSDSDVGPDNSRDRALELLRKLRRQIQNRRPQ